MIIRLILANIFNLADAVLTLILLHLGWGVEGNIVMAQLVGKPLAFLFVKCLTALALSLWIGQSKGKYSVVASWVMCIAFGAIVLWNLGVFVYSLLAVNAVL